MSGSAAPAKLARRRRGSSTRSSTLERRYPATPAGLGVTVSWGLPYFRRLVPKLADGRRYPKYLPVDRGASKPERKHVAAVLDAARFAERPGPRSCSAQTTSRSSSAATTPRTSTTPTTRCSTSLGRPLRRSERAKRLRRRWLRAWPRARQADGARGRSPRRRPDRRRRADVPRLHVDAEGGDGARPDRELRDAARPDRPDAAELLERRCGDAPVAPERGPRALVVAGAVPRPAARDDAAGAIGARQDVHDRRGHLARRARGRRTQRPCALRCRRPQRDPPDGLPPARRHARRLRRVANAGNGDHPACRLQHARQPVRLRARSRRKRRRRRPPACTSSRLRRRPISSTARAARWTARSATARRCRSTRRAPALGFNSFIHATHRQNFVTPPRAHRSFPLVEQLRKRA